ncbi:hypothetical protein [Maricaulis parjimensis]|uniref:hypothetical protein n=1 Tax=Maricaulis parjimensis TaxID=144023 RepID=UPI00193AC532|nr:hypothetical protein [Maricaulis parjimensis]
MVRETHYFAAYPEASEGQGSREPVEFYRLQVRANTAFSSSRFVAGYYDERAVDFLFDELRTEDATQTGVTSDSRQLSILGQGEGSGSGNGNGGGDAVQIFQPTDKNGAFVLILSSNADSVARTIGAFSESQLVVESITQLLSRDRIEAANRSNAQASTQSSIASALTTAFDQSLERAAGAETGDQAREEYLRSLYLLARSLGRTAPFESFEEARGWFDSQSTRAMEEMEP